MTNAAVSSTANVEGIALSPDYARDGTVLVSVGGVGLFRSTDRGNTFVAVGASLLDHDLVIRDFQNPTSEPIQFSPTFATDHTVYAYAQQSVLRSTDGGVTWTVLDIPPSSEFAGAKLRPGTEARPRRRRASGANGNGDDGVPVVPIAIAVVVIAAAGAILVAYRRRASRAV